MIITDSAQKQLNELLADGECLEIGLKGGGCNGLMITLEKTNSIDTTELSIGDKTKFADKTSQTYLQGGSLDYEDKGFLKDLWLTQVKVQESADAVTASLFHRCNNFIIFRR